MVADTLLLLRAACCVMLVLLLLCHIAAPNVTLMLHSSFPLLLLKACFCCSLVSGLAADTSLMYAEGATAVQQASQGMPAPKAALYAQWKAAAFSAYLHAFAGG